jgi:hypothetical protein
MPAPKLPTPNSNQGGNNVADLPRPELMGHAWVQQGTHLLCQSCTFHHSTAILDASGMPTSDYQLIGLQTDGTPIFRKITLNAGAAAPK